MLFEEVTLGDGDCVADLGDPLLTAVFSVFLGVTVVLPPLLRGVLWLELVPLPLGVELLLLLAKSLSFFQTRDDFLCNDGSAATSVILP